MAVAEQYDDVRKIGVDYFYPEDYLIDIVRRATVNNQNVAISHAEAGELIALLPCTGRAPQGGSAGRRRSLDPTAETVGRDVDELMWQAGFYASGGRLMEGCYRDDVIRLTGRTCAACPPHGTPQWLRQDLGGLPLRLHEKSPLLALAHKNVKSFTPKRDIRRLLE